MSARVILFLLTSSVSFLIVDEEDPGDGEDDSIMDEIEEQEGKIGAKKRRKLEEKAEKKRQREVSSVSQIRWILSDNLTIIFHVSP